MCKSSDVIGKIYAYDAHACSILSVFVAPTTEHYTPLLFLKRLHHILCVVVYSNCPGTWSVAVWLVGWHLLQKITTSAYISVSVINALFFHCWLFSNLQKNGQVMCIPSPLLDGAVDSLTHIDSSRCTAWPHMRSHGLWNHSDFSQILCDKSQTSGSKSLLSKPSQQQRKSQT